MNGVNRDGKLAQTVVHVGLGLLAAAICSLVFEELWSFLNTRHDYSARHQQAHRRLVLLRDQIEAFQAYHGGLPKTLMDLYVPLPQEIIPTKDHVQYHHFGWDGRFDEEARPLDPWGFPYIYAPTNGRFELYTTGADGVQGGVGVNADLSSDDPPDAVNAPTFAQLVWEPDPARRVRGFVFSFVFWGGMTFVIYLLASHGFGRILAMQGYSYGRWVRFTQTFALRLILTIIFASLIVAVGSMEDAAHYLRPEPPPFVV
jgi:hypothetical protein